MWQWQTVPGRFVSTQFSKVVANHLFLFLKCVLVKSVDPRMQSTLCGCYTWMACRFDVYVGVKATDMT
jgi:hypothetical protein